MEQGPLGHRPSWPPIDPAQVSEEIISCRHIYTFFFRLRRQSLWDISQPPSPAPSLSTLLSVREREAADSELLLYTAQLRNPLPVSSLHPVDFSRLM